MAAPVRLEAEAFGDPRFDVLGQLLGTSKYDALGRMAHMWSWATDRGRLDVPEHIAAVYFDGSVNRVAFVVLAELGEYCECTQQNGDSTQQNPTKASRHPAGCQHIRVAGAAGRLEWLSEHRATKTEAGRKRAETAARGPNGAFLPKRPAHAGSAGPAPDQQATSRPPAESSVLSLSLSTEEKSSAAPSAGGAQGVLDKIQEHLGDVGLQRALSGKRAPKSGPTADERKTALEVLAKLGTRNGVRYSGTSDHIQLIAARLRDGVTADDLARVVDYCAIGIWKDKPEMRQYLRPETLFGPKTIGKYLDPARSWGGRSLPAGSQSGASYRVASNDEDMPPLPPWVTDAESEAAQ